MESIHLVGAEDVRCAGHSIRQAAEDIRHAAGSMSEIGAPIQAFSEFVGRFENAVACLGEIEAMKAENSHRMNTGQSVAYGDEAFFSALERHGMRSA